MPLAERRREGIQVLIGNISSQASEGEMATEPLVDHHRKCILITGRNRLAEDQFRGHVRQGTKAFLDLQWLSIRGQQGQAKIAQQYFVFWSQQYVLRFQIAMHQVLIMGTLQGRGKRHDMRDDGREGHYRPRRTQPAQVAIGCIVHHQKRRFLFQTEVEHTNDMRMHQVADVTRLGEKVCQRGRVQPRAQDFDGDRGIQIEVLTEIHIGKSTFAQKLNQTIIPQPLLYLFHYALYFLLYPLIVSLKIANRFA